MSADLQRLDTLIQRLQRIGEESAALCLLGRLREGLAQRSLMFTEGADGERTIFWVGAQTRPVVCVPRHPEPVSALLSAVRLGGIGASVSHLAKPGPRQRLRITERLASARNAIRRSSPELADELDAGIHVERTCTGYSIRFVSSAVIHTDTPPAKGDVYGVQSV